MSSVTSTCNRCKGEWSHVVGERSDLCKNCRPDYPGVNKVPQCPDCASTVAMCTEVDDETVEAECENSMCELSPRKLSKEHVLESYYKS